MTHQNHQTNGASLEDCHTNFFALTDLCGIKWRKLVLGERPNATGDPLDDPVLESYTKCLAKDILCVWRRVSQQKNDLDQTGVGGGLFDISLGGQSGNCSGTVIHPPLSLTAAKELWIFWYGEEPDLSDLVSPELLKQSDGAEQGSWESGLSYECRSLLFKALHNLIERCLLSRDIVRLGKWFVQPSSEQNVGKSSVHLSFSFAFFVHGDSTVCASMDIREHPPVRPLTLDYLNEALKQQTQIQQNLENKLSSSSSSNNNNSNNTDSIENSLNNDYNNNDSANNSQPKSVILAPFGLSATLTGFSYQITDQQTQKVLNDWSEFYPLPFKESKDNFTNNDEFPPVVEIVAGGVKMRYPSKYVLITEVDSKINELKHRNSNLNNLNDLSKKVSICDNVNNVNSNNGNNETSVNDNNNNENIANDKNRDNYAKHEKNSNNTIPSELYLKKSVETNTIVRSLSNIPMPSNSGLVLPEKVWQDAIMNPAFTKQNDSTNSSDLSTDQNKDNDNADKSSCVWEFMDPSQKASCTCIKCKKTVASHRNSSSSSSTSNIAFTSSSSAMNITGSTSGSGSSLSGKQYSRLSSRINRMPFHKRNSSTSATNYHHTSLASISKQKDTKSINSSAYDSKNSMSSNYNNPSTSISSTSSVQQPTTTTSDIRYSNGSYCRNPGSISESQQMSVGSPASATASPMPPNLSVHSQPSSIPPNDHLMSPNQPMSANPRSVSSQHPTTPNLDNIIDVKPTLPNNLLAMTPSNDNQMDKSSAISPRPSTSNTDTATTSDVSGNVDSKSGQEDKNAETENCSNSITSFSLKRPILSIRDYENIVDEDYMSHQLLYDYSTWDAWMMHPIKRFKPEEAEKLKTHKYRIDLYEGQKYSHSSTLPCILNQQSASEREANSSRSSPDGHSLINSYISKGHPHDSDADRNCNNDSLFTSEGLQPSFEDLNKIFDNSDDDTIIVHTPPGSNKSNAGGTEIIEIRRARNNNIHNSGTTNNESKNPNAPGIIRNEEFSKMFPTPPSLEQNPNSSPCGASGNNLDSLIVDTMDHQPNINSICTLNKPKENYPNLGSPPAEAIEDFSYVYVPPKIVNFVSSSKYAPLTNLPSQTLPPIVLPSNCFYKPSWILKKEQDEQQKQKENQEQTNAKNSNNNNTNNNNNISNKENQNMNERLPNNAIKQEVVTNTQPRPPFNTMKQLPPNGQSGSSIMSQILNSSNNNNNNVYPSQHSPHPHAHMANKGMVRPPMMSPMDAVTSPYPNQFHHQAFGNMINNRSPHPNDLFKKQQLLLQQQQQQQQHQHHEHSQPPPPYEVAVHSPALGSNRMMGMNMYNQQHNQQHQQQQQMQSQMNQNPQSNQQQKTPEANALLVNILLYDTSLNIFRDHNFDSCTLCVCNAGPNCVGNIRGADSGTYLSLTDSCHFNDNLLNVLENCQRKMEKNCTAIEPLAPIKIKTLHNLYQNSPASSTSSIASPMCGNQNQNNGYLDEDPISCRCGFSAVMNRRLAYKNGLFYEDEMDITGMPEDPVVYKKSSLMSVIMKLEGKCDAMEVKIKTENDNEQAKQIEKAKEEMSSNVLPLSLMDLLREQCSVIRNSSNSIQRAISHYIARKPNTILTDQNINLLEFVDAFDVITLAIEQSRLVQEKQDSVDGFNNKMLVPHQKRRSHHNSKMISVHKWPYLYVDGPKSNQDIVRIMQTMQPLLQDAFHKKCTTRLWDAPYTVKGPLTWREFHRLAGRGTGQCEPQPIPSVIVGHDKDWLSVAPYAIHYWDKLLLEPYSYPRDVAYIVVAPDNDYIVSRVKIFFKELSTTYEMCRLGRHQPVKGWEGILRVGKLKKSDQHLEEWFAALGKSKTSDLIRMYGSTFQQHLIPYLQKIPQDKSLLDPPEGYNSSSNNSHHKEKISSMPSPMLPPHTPDNQQNSNPATSNCEKAPSTPKSTDQGESDNNRDSLNSSSIQSEPYIDSQDANPPHIVLYLVEPFTSSSDSTDLERLACLSLLKCYSNILNSVPESIKTNISVQIISQENILELGRNRELNRWSDHMRNLALNVFSQSRRFLSHTNNVKSLTGFGTAANVEQFLKNKDEKNRAPYKLYTPPYILSTQREKSENAENFGQISVEQQCSIIYCSYCLSEDQSWLLAVATDERGEFVETCTINIDVPNRRRRRKASARRIGLQKLMDFILGVISQTVRPWRLVIGRVGRIGHGELKGWSWLLSKQNLLKASKHLKDICQQCSLMYPHAVPSILSACLVTLEPDTKFRVMPDQFTPDERFSQLSMQSPLSTPQDVSCTHILVFPTSAITQSSQTAFLESHNTGLEFGIGDDFLLEEGDGVDDVTALNGIESLFDTWGDGAVGMPPTSPNPNQNPGSPDGGMNDGSRHTNTPGTPGQQRNHIADVEEVGQLLQQPLALGYLVSTAPTGPMPSWFWSSCPHLENVCPVFLKTALLIHSSSVHQNDDIFQQQTSSATDHPLDSSITADVLRYVLEGYNVLSWLAMDSNSHDRLSCLPIHIQLLMQLYQMTAALA